MAISTTNERELVDALIKAFHGMIGVEWVSLRDLKTRLLNARVSMSYDQLETWINHLIGTGKVETQKEGHMNVYRLKEYREEKTMSEPNAIQETGIDPPYSPQISAVSALVERENTIKDIIDNFFELGKHYGPAFPNAKTNSLYKLGAEWLASAFHLVPEYDVIRRVIVPDRGNVEVTFEIRCTLKAYQGGDFRIVGSAIGICTSEEEAYKYRNVGRVCPSCGKETIRRGAKKYGGGWYCSKKDDGCGASFKGGTPEEKEIDAQETRKEINPEILALQHNILTKAEKRAFVLAIRTALCVSAYFDDVVPDEDTGSYARSGDTVSPRLESSPANGGAFKPMMAQTLIDFALELLPENTSRKDAGGTCLAAMGNNGWGDPYDGSLNDAKAVIQATIEEQQRSASVVDSEPDAMPLWVPEVSEVSQMIKEAAAGWDCRRDVARKHLVTALGLTGTAKGDSDLQKLIAGAYHGDYGTAMMAVSLYEFPQENEADS